MTRKQRAVIIRDHVLALLKERAAQSEQASKPQITSRVVAHKIDDFLIFYRTPFQRLPKVPEIKKYTRAFLGGKANLPYGMDIWYKDQKVMNLEWSGDQIDLVSFKSGKWEEILLGKCDAVSER